MSVADPPRSPVDSQAAWYRRSVDATLDALGTSDAGLSADVAAERLVESGPNELTDGGGRSPLQLIWEQLTAVMVLILIGAAVLSAILGKYLEAGAIGAIVVLFTLLGFYQEYRAEQAIQALRRMAVPSVRVTRGGVTVEIDSVDLVPGDVVSLEAGNVVPADLRLIESVGLSIQESALTGESEAVHKDTETIAAHDTALGDRFNMAYSGTQVTFGRGRGVVVETGMRTELGRIATLLADVDESMTPLQAKLDKVGKQLALAGVLVAGVVVALGALGGEKLGDLVLTAISVAVAVIPEGLPAVVTVTLAIGAQRMLKRHALIRKLPAVETLGSVTVICSDKTGTLTLNQMTVTRVWTPEGEAIVDANGLVDSPPAVSGAASMVVAAGVLCNDSEVRVDADGTVTSIGDPTETALVTAAQRLGMDYEGLRTAMPRIGEMPFDSGRKRMSTIHRMSADGPEVFHSLESRGRVAFIKGAIDRIIDHTNAVWFGGCPVPLDEGWRDQLGAANTELASQGMRVLAVAYRDLPDEVADDRAEDELTLLGLVGIIDPPRSEVRDAVAVCRTAGIRTVMITGDHPLTASAIASDLGFAEGGAAVTGAELDRMADNAFGQAVAHTSVFARVSPEHKLRIVNSLQAQDQVVAMTGDGVNDAPALKKADIGVAMGITGTDVSKEASDMVLRDDNFATIVAAVEEGRVIFDNLRRFVKFAVAGNIGKILVMVLWPIPFLLRGESAVVAMLPLQLLWLNLMTDGLLGLSLGVEPAESTVMSRKPQTPGTSIWADGLGIQAIWVGSLIGFASLAVAVIYHAGTDVAPAPGEPVLWQTMVFTTLAFMQVFQAIGTRSTTDSLSTIGLTTNPLMLWIVGLVSGLQLLALYTPLNKFLDLVPLSAKQLAICVGLGVALLVVMETEKAFRRSRQHRHNVS